MSVYEPRQLDELRDTLMDRVDALPFMSWPADLLMDLIELFDIWMPTLRPADARTGKPRLHVVR